MFKVQIRFVRRIQFARKGDDGGLDAGGYGRASPGFVLFYKHTDGKRIGWIYISLFGVRQFRIGRTGYNFARPWPWKAFPRTLG